MKITNVQAYVVSPDYGNLREVNDDWQWTLVTITTDEGLTGRGEASSVPRGGSLLTGRGIQAVREALIGEDPTDIERIWHKLFRRYTYMGSRGFPSAIVSGIDIALWDLKGKALNVPIYNLLGGSFRETIRTYANAWFEGCETAEQYAAAAAACRGTSPATS
mgnify:CR=1 FL=1